MTWLMIVWGSALIAATWFVPVAAIRVLAWRSGTDATSGMRDVAIVAVVCAAIAVLVLVVASAFVLARTG